MDSKKAIAKKLVSIGIRTRIKRKEMCLRLIDLAVDSECSLSVIADLERGIASGLTVGTLIKIAIALEITPEELFCE